MSNPYKPIPKALFVESLEEYYFGDVINFDSSTGKAFLHLGWRDEDNDDELGWEYQIDVDPIRISAFPCILPVGGVDHQNSIYMPGPDVRDWQMGNLLSDNNDGTFTVSVVDTANPGTVVSVTAPMMAYENTGAFWMPYIGYKTSDEIGEFFANNYGPIP